MQLFFGAGQGVLHLGLQIVIVVLLLGAGDVLLGLEQEYVTATGNQKKLLLWSFDLEFLISVSVSIASVILSCIVLGVSYLSGQEFGRLSRDLSTPAS